MTKKSVYHKTMIGQKTLQPETLMLGYGYSCRLSEGAVKPPVYLASTFVFESAEHGKDFFDMASGRKIPEFGQSAGLVYSRFNHPNCEIVEDRLAIYEGAEDAALFSTGMAAIATSILAFSNPGDVIVHSQPLYGGTDVFFQKVLARFGVKSIGFFDGLSEEEMRACFHAAQKQGRISVIYLETPSNPLNTLVDLKLIAKIRQDMCPAGEEQPPIFCDNTLLGPVYQKPLEHGADLSLYSATKYIGGHSDLVAGAIAGSDRIVRPIKLLRGCMGTSLDPHTSWMVGRSLETVGLRMRAACEGAQKIATFLRTHPKVETVFYLGFLKPEEKAFPVFKRQCGSAGATFSFNIKGGRPEAFAFLNALQIFKLAVSLGGTESLVCHPATTVHSGVPQALREKMGIEEKMIRISVGIEDPDDLIADLAQAFEHF